MHPGIKVFVQGFGCGFMTLALMACLTRQDFGGAAVAAAIMTICFWYGFSGAEKLRAARPTSGETNER